MNLGLAIFLSSLILGFIFLFHSTKDRCNWKKIMKTIVISLLSLIIIFSFYYYFFLHSNNFYFQKPSQVTLFWSIKLGSTADDLKFIKGVPEKVDSINSVWLYEYRKYYGKDEYYKIKFYKNIVTSILYFGGKDKSYNPPHLFGRNFSGYNLQSIKDYLGEPTSVSSSRDGLKRIFSFDTFNVIFFMEEDKVFGYGIYDPNYVTYKYQ